MEGDEKKKMEYSEYFMPVNEHKKGIRYLYFYFMKEAYDKKKNSLQLQRYLIK